MKFSFFLLLLFITGVSHATDYYVSTSGNDANNGTSQTTAWQTLTKVESVCNAGTIHAGDRILFKCGDQFTGKMIIASIWGKNAKSGTAASPITLGSYGTGAKPVFLYPQGGTTPAESRVEMWFAGVDYWVVDGLNFTDLDVSNNKVTPANQGIPLYLGSSGDANCNHWTVQNVDISLCGMGVVLVGDYNLIQNCNLTNFKNLKSTSGGYEDYGANPFTLLDGNYNTIKNNYVTGGWAESLDFGFNGGFCEMFGSCSNNSFMYNTIIDCNGLSEFGANGATATSLDNLYAYNKLIDNGAMFYCNISGPFACQVGNVQFFNNTVVETNNSRFALGSTNAGAGVTSPEAISHINLDSYMFLYNGTPTAATVYTIKNNIFNIANPLKICRSGEARLTHDYEVFKLSGGSTFALALNTHEVSTSAVVFANTTAANATNWDLNLTATSPGIDRGISVGIPTDFIGTPVPTVPNAGIYETVGGASTLAANSTAGAITCNGGTTTITVTASGGTAPYTGTGTFTVTAGTYTYNVTDAAGTIKTTSITIIQPTAVTVTLSPGTIATYGGTTTLTATATGGTSGYTYKLNSGAYQSSNTFTGVVAGTYSVTAKDANGCTAIQTITITQPAATNPLIAASTAGVVSCNGGNTSVTVSATGGVAPYTGTGNFTVNAGTYSYTITDAAGTTATTSITVTQPAAIAVSLTPGTITVFGGTTTLTVNATGGTGAYSYKLNSGAYQSSNTFTGVVAGTYSVTVRDVNGCSSVQTITITQPAATATLVATSTAGSILCNGGTALITVSATGGRIPYTGTGTFTVSAGTYNYTVTDANGATATTSIIISQPTAIVVTLSSGTIAVYGGTTTLTASATGGSPVYAYMLDAGTYQATTSFVNVAAGTHTITVKDKNNCTSVKTIIITEPAAAAPLIASSTAGTISCNAGTTTVTVSATGGTTPYTGTGSFTVNAGTYTYTVTDAAGLTASTSVIVSQPTAITAAIAAGTVTGPSGTTTATITAAGGTPGYTYSLDGGSYQSSNVFTGVTAGTHTVTVRDGRACSIAKSFTVLQSNTAPLVITAVATTVSCYGSTANITISATGGTIPYTGTGNFTVAAGTYTYTVTDASGTTGTTTILVTQPTAIVATASAGTITVNGGTTTVTAGATGGTGPYTYQLNSGSYQVSNTFTAVTAGTYTITIKDVRGCTATKSITITQPTSTAPFKLNLVSKTNETCKGKRDGKIVVNCTGGTAPYTYRINFGTYTSNNVFSNLAPGFYVVTGKSATGTTYTLYIYISASRTVCTGKSGDENNVTGNTELKSTEPGELKINVYPNPTSTEFSLLIEKGSQEEAHIIVSNVNGLKVYEGRAKSFEKIYFGSKFVTGIYFVKVIQGKSVQNLKVIKAN